MILNNLPWYIPFPGLKSAFVFLPEMKLDLIGESIHMLAVEFYQATTSCFATLLYSGPLCSTCQCGFSLPTRPWLPQAYLCWRLSDEQKPIKVFKWMLLFSVHTIEIFHVFNWQSVKELAKNDNEPRGAINTATLSNNRNTENNTQSSTNQSENVMDLVIS